ncbi:hypothetical protein J1N35_039048, partial [Gossypium stocksii]
LIIFGKADEYQTKLLKGILEDFCDFSVTRVSEELRRHLNEILGFCKVQNLGSYLGVHPLHDK